VLTKAEIPVVCSDNEPGVINSSVYASREILAAARAQ